MQRNAIDLINCASSWKTRLHITKMHGQQYIKIPHYWLVLPRCSVIILCCASGMDGICFIPISMYLKVGFLSFTKWFNVFCIMMLASVVLWYVCNIKFPSPLNVSKSRKCKFSAVFCYHFVFLWAVVIVQILFCGRLF